MRKSEEVSYQVGCYKDTSETLLWAFYSKPYTLSREARRVVGLASMAKYHVALPAPSRTLDGALLRSPEFVLSLFEVNNAW
jgi:hypothetical protein